MKFQTNKHPQQQIVAQTRLIHAAILNPVSTSIVQRDTTSHILATAIKIHSNRSHPKPGKTSN